MHVERVHHIDCSEPDEAGMHEYYYEYDMYYFTDGPLSLSVRCYTDEPDEGSFVGIGVDGETRALELADLSRPIFLAAMSHLKTEGKVLFSWFSGIGYEPISVYLSDEA
jgi:hypothetical protein